MFKKKRIQNFTYKIRHGNEYLEFEKQLQQITNFKKLTQTINIRSTGKQHIFINNLLTELSDSFFPRFFGFTCYSSYDHDCVLFCIAREDYLCCSMIGQNLCLINRSLEKFLLALQHLVTSHKFLELRKPVLGFFHIGAV